MYEEVEEKEVTVTLEDGKEPEAEKEPEQEQVEVQASELSYSNTVKEDKLDMPSVTRKKPSELLK